MAFSESDIAELFAPLKPAQAFGVVLSEARQVLAHVRQPIDAELWGSDMIGALGSGESGPDDSEVMRELALSVVPAAEEDATPESLALLRILGAVGGPPLRRVARAAADRVAAGGVPDADWAAAIGSPSIGKCWHYSDVGGRQESVTVSFGYGTAEHALIPWLREHGGKSMADSAEQVVSSSRPLSILLKEVGSRWRRSMIGRRLIERAEAPELERQREARAAMARLAGRLRGRDGKR